MKQKPIFHAVKAESGWVVMDDAGEVLATYFGRGKGKAENHASRLTRGLAVEHAMPNSTP